MKKIVLILLLNISFLFSEDSFIKICKNPTPEQNITLKAMLKIVNKDRLNQPTIEFHNPKICEILDKEFIVIPYLQNANISDISILKYFPNTPTLNLWNNKITDITPLKYLTKLTKLNLSSNKVSKGVESLEKLPLKELSIDITDNIDLKYIGKIRTLENLSIFHGKNYKELNNLKNLKYLSLLSVNIKSLCDLKGLQSLEKLRLFDNNLKSLECIDQFPNLKKLRIERSPITDLTPLINADSITDFHFYNMPVEDISPLAKMKNLHAILFSKTKIKYLSPLKSSKSIKFAEDTREKFIEEYFNRSLAWCSPKSMKEVRTGKTCLNEDGSLKPWWKRILGL
ncbi:MAG: leucine-rich repeat domain-containing protein [Halarcobacter sp.]